MQRFIKLSQYASLMGIHYRTAARHFHNGQLLGYQDEITNTIYIENPDYLQTKDTNNKIKAVLYARVSSTTNKASLNSQIERLTQYAAAKGYEITKIEKEIASGLNDNRRKFSSILKSSDWDILLVEHKDRLTRFGFNHITQLLEKTNQQVEVINKTENKDTEIMEDFVSIVTSFCGRIYGANRKAKTQKIIKELEKEKEAHEE